MANITSPRDPDASPPVAGLVLAAGGGSRYGGPKALARDADGTSWLLRAVDALAHGGCDPVVVVLGAGADAAEHLLTPGAGVRVVRAATWATGLSASLHVGLGAVAALVPERAAVVVVPVDVPDLTPLLVVRLVSERPGGTQVDRVDSAVLRRAVFAGRPGHPVVLGRAHWAPLRAELTGDSGARAYLAARDVVEIECGDLGTGLDVDRA